MSLIRLGLAAGAVLALANCSAARQADRDAAALRADGRAIAQAQCATCHAVGLDDESPAPEAPVFRHILARYSDAALNEDLINGIQVAHPMPAFQFNPQGADALIAYMRSIQTPEIEETR
jgi:mono/diheme cytochrome c family protein